MEMNDFSCYSSILLHKEALQRFSDLCKQLNLLSIQVLEVVLLRNHRQTDHLAIHHLQLRLQLPQKLCPSKDDVIQGSEPGRKRFVVEL